jgi:enamine deaminase RidA (YjgF/YER057c/UK114 family)
MKIERKRSNQRMSQIVVHGSVVYLAGQVALDEPGVSVREQTMDTLARVDMLLKEAGTDKSRLLAATVWLTDISTFDEMNAVWDAWVSPGNPPARACIEAALAGPKGNYAVEIMVTAALP